MSKTKGKKKFKVKIDFNEVVELKKYEGIDPTQKNPALAISIGRDLRLAINATYKLTKDIYKISVKDKKKKKSKRVLTPYHHAIIKKTWETYQALIPMIFDGEVMATFSYYSIESARLMAVNCLYSFMAMVSISTLVNELTRTIPVLISPSRIYELRPAIIKNIIAVAENSVVNSLLRRRYDEENNTDFIHDEDDDVIDDEEEVSGIERIAREEAERVLSPFSDEEVIGIEKRFEEAKERARQKIREMADSIAPIIPIVDPSTDEGKTFLREHSTPVSAAEDEITEKDKEFLREHAPDKSLKFTEVFEIYFSDLNEKAQKRLLEFYGMSSPSEANWDMDILPIAVCEKDAEPKPEEANEEPDTDK